jgi:hypothetical protein
MGGCEELMRLENESGLHVCKNGMLETLARNCVVNHQSKALAYHCRYQTKRFLKYSSEKVF